MITVGAAFHPWRHDHPGRFEGGALRIGRMHREVGTAINAAGQIDPLPRSRRRRDVTHAVVEDIESQPTIQGPVVEVIGVKEEDLKHRESHDHRVERRTDLIVIDGVGHRRIDADLTKLIEVRGPGRVMQVVREGPEATPALSARSTGFPMKRVDAFRPPSPLRLVDPSSHLLVVHDFDSGPSSTVPDGFQLPRRHARSSSAPCTDHEDPRSKNNHPGAGRPRGGRRRKR